LSRARLLPVALAAFRQDFPQMELSVVEGSHAELVGPLRDGDIDMMVGALRGPTIGLDLTERRLFEDRPTIIVRKGHPLEAGWDSEALCRYPWIVPAPGTPLRQLWSAMFADLGIAPPQVPIECGSVMMVRQLLLSDDYLTLLSIDQFSVELQLGLVVDIGPAPGNVSRTIGLTSRADWRPTPAQDELVNAIERTASRLY
jgi:DNA-binding transcriptional LysR family regulator